MSSYGRSGVIIILWDTKNMEVGEYVVGDYNLN